MKVLFLESHPLWIHGLPNGFADAGHTAIISGPLTKNNISEMIEIFHPDLAVSLGWSPEHTPEKQKWIREVFKNRQIPLVYWATEDPLHTENFSLPLVKRMKPNFVFTVTPSLCSLYEKNGFNSAYLDFGYHKSVHCPTEPMDQYSSDIAVVANAYPEFFMKNPDSFRFESLQTLIFPLIDNNFRIDFWGNQWDSMTFFLKNKIPKHWMHGYLHYTEANKVYSSAKIVIGLQNCTDQLTQRTYEILGSGGFLLTSDTPAVREKFEPNRHLVVSSSPDETIEKVKYYLNHPAKREKISKNGREANEKESYKNRAIQMINILVDQGILSYSLSSYPGKVVFYTDFINENYVVHVTKPRDTLNSISQKYQVPIEQIVALNNLEDDFIDTGLALKIKEKSRKYERI